MPDIIRTEMLEKSYNLLTKAPVHALKGACLRAPFQIKSRC